MDITERDERSSVITIKMGKEHMLLTHQDITDTKSLMYPAFRAALEALKRIVECSDIWIQEHQKQHVNVCDNRNVWDTDGFYEYSNNILAFCAPRGQGKTSAMLSFCRAIVNGPSRNQESQKTGREQIAFIQNYSFFDLPPIDPTMLSDGESVVQLVLSRLFHEISYLWEHPLNQNCQSSLNSEEAKKFDVLECFKTCYHGLQYINKQNKQEKDIDDFEKMLTTGDIFYLKESIHQIVRYFFQLKGYPDEKKCFLLIPLDDTDMQMKHAYSILEEVRKYLALPNVVVLMATHLNQLRTLIMQQYVDQLKIGDISPEEYFAQIHRMTAKYLDKLIPATQTVYLPTMQLQRDMGQKLQLVIERDGEKSGKQRIWKQKYSPLCTKKLVWHLSGTTTICIISCPKHCVDSSIYTGC